MLDVATGTVTRVAGLPPADAVAASGPVWAPPTRPGEESDAVVCPVWLGDIHNFKSTSRRLGSVFCFNRPSALFLAKAPISGADREPGLRAGDANHRKRVVGDVAEVHPGRQNTRVRLARTRGVRRALRHRVSSRDVVVRRRPRGTRVVVPVVDVPERRGAFPGVYASSPPPAEPWLTREDGSGVDMVLQTTWGAGEAIGEPSGDGERRRESPPAAVGEGAWIGDGNPDAENDADVERGGGGSWALCDVRDGVVAAIRSSPGSVPEARVAWFRKPLEDEPFRAGGRGVKSATPAPPRKPAMDAIASLEYDVATVSRECVAGDGGDENPDAPATVQSIVVRARTERDDASTRRVPSL